MIDAQKITSVLQQDCHLEPTRLLLVGVSGGADSLCLLNLLAAGGWQVVAAHFDHHIRATSSQDAQFVCGFAQQIGVHCVVGEAEPGSLVEQKGSSLEGAARIARYQFLLEQARELGAQAVLTAHTADDQVETVLLHLLRGSGLDGLTGMPYRKVLSIWDESIPIVRPMLGVWRSEVDAYCQHHLLQPVEDETNQDITYLRNRLRREIIPILEDVNPQFKSSMVRMAKILREDANLLESLTDDEQLGVNFCSGEGWASLNAPGLQQLPLAIQRRLLRRAWQKVCGSVDELEFDAVERARSLLVSPSRKKRVQLSHGMDAWLEGEQIYLTLEGVDAPLENYPQVETGLCLEIDPPYSLSLAGGWRFMSDYLKPGAVGSLMSQDTHEAILDADRMILPLIIRTPHSGERMLPLGMGGKTQKLSDIFINQRIPRRARKNYPLIVSGDQIAWLPGYRSTEYFRVTDETQRILHLRVVKDVPDEGLS